MLNNLLSALDTLSRLKGIETLSIISSADTADTALDTLSRLKGIETLCIFTSPLPAIQVFGYAFRFEGNGNLKMATLRC